MGIMKQSINVLMAENPLVTFREKFRGIFTSSPKKRKWKDQW